MMIYLEGSHHLRRPMRQFIRKAVGGAPELDIKPCGSGDDAINECRKDADALLLIDAEGTMSQQFVDRVSAAIGRGNHPFFMVQLMEAWFLADRAALAGYFGAGFRENALPGNPNVEAIPKPDVLNGLGDATRGTRKGRYSKGAHDADLLRWIDASAVYAACPNFARLVDFLRRGPQRM